MSTGPEPRSGMWVKRTEALDIFERVDSRRQDEENGSGWPALLKGLLQLKPSPIHVPGPQVLLHVVPAIKQQNDI